MKRINFFSPVKLNTRANVRNIKRQNLTYPQALLRYPKLKAFGDADHDGKLNMFDCRPFDKIRDGWKSRGIKFNRERSTYVKMMSPEKFLRTTKREAINKGGRYDSQRDFEDEVLDKKNIRRLKKMIESDEEKVDIPFIEYDRKGRPTGHEGRHRAAAARAAGVKLIPVTIAQDLDEPRDWKHMRQVWRYKGTKHDWRNELENVDEVVSSKSADIPIAEQKRYGKESPEALRDFDMEDDD